MKLRKLFAVAILGVVAMLSLSSCNGMFSGIYDQPAKEAPEYGFQESMHDLKPGKLYIDASKYDNWVYIDFHNEKVTNVPIVKGDDGVWVEGEAPSEWDLAIHRYDMKTNGGAALETNYQRLLEIVTKREVPQGNYVEDIALEGTITTQGITVKNGIYVYMEDMMTTGPVTIPSKINPILAKWLHVDTKTMPPIYSPSGKVYSVRLKDGSHIALKVDNYMNDEGKKGYLTINYVYPIERK